MSKSTSDVFIYLFIGVMFDRFTIDGATVYAVQILYNLLQKEPEAKVVARSNGKYGCTMLPR